MSVVVDNSGHFIFSGDLAKLAVNFAGVHRFLLKCGYLFAVRCCVVGAEFS